MKINVLVGSRVQILFGCVIKTLLDTLAIRAQLLEVATWHMCTYILSVYMYTNPSPKDKMSPWVLPVFV